jgi:hypothetical protein
VAHEFYFKINLVPRNKLKDLTIFDRINSNIKNFTWNKCLKYPARDDREKFCNILFQSKTETKKCLVNKKN